MGWTDSGCVTFLTFVLRYLVFDLQESPKYLVAQGRDEEAIEVILIQEFLDSRCVLIVVGTKTRRSSQWQDHHTQGRGSSAHLGGLGGAQTPRYLAGDPKELIL
jgi:hypothetical protein